MDERHGRNVDAGSSAEPVTEASLVERFRSRLVVFASRRLGNAQAAEDVAQETLRRVLVACRERRLDKPEALAAFVYQTARNVCLQGARKLRRERRAVGRVGREPEPASPDPMSGLVSRERARAVSVALGRIAAPDRELLRRLFWEGRSHEELAAELGIEPQALRVRKHRALKRLAQQLEEAIS